MFLFVWQWLCLTYLICYRRILHLFSFSYFLLYIIRTFFFFISLKFFISLYSFLTRFFYGVIYLKTQFISINVTSFLYSCWSYLDFFVLSYLSRYIILHWLFPNISIFFSKNQCQEYLPWVLVFFFDFFIFFFHIIFLS